jgi:hypothetical protein
MIQAILSYQFELIPGKDDILEPEFTPIKLIFNNEHYSEDNYSDLIDRMDIFGTFYQHTTGMSTDIGAFSNFHIGRLKNTPYQVISHFRQDTNENQFITIAIFELEDEIEIFEELIYSLGRNLETQFERLINEKSVDIYDRIESEFRFAIFQVNRLSDLSKLQKAALIFSSEERYKILEILRERPVSKKELKDILEKVKPNPNIDILIQPFLELNLIRRDWIKGITRKKEIDLSYQGEYLFLIKDITLARFPDSDLMDRIKEYIRGGFKEYKQKLVNFFSKYDVISQSIEDIKKLADALLTPDIFDLYTLLTHSYYPLDKIPKIFSDFVDTEFVVSTLEKLQIITKIQDENKRPWIVLLTKITPLISFPEYLTLKIKEAYLSEDRSNKISYEIAKKALDLLQETYQEKVSF